MGSDPGRVVGFNALNDLVHRGPQALHLGARRHSRILLYNRKAKTTQFSRHGVETSEFIPLVQLKSWKSEKFS